jgi:hypothetical protein
MTSAEDAGLYSCLDCGAAPGGAHDWSKHPAEPTHPDQWDRVLYVPTWGYDCDEENTGGKAFSEKQREATRRSKQDAHERAAWMREHGENVIVIRLRPRATTSPPPNIPILRTQADVDEYIGRCERLAKDGGRVAFDPTEEIDLTTWIGPHECCSHCGEATPGLRRDEKGHPDEKCAACGTTGFLITTWGEAQTERWESGERYRDEKSLDRDDGPIVGPVYVLDGSRHARALRRQLRHAMVRILKPTMRLRAAAAR